MGSLPWDDDCDDEFQYEDGDENDDEYNQYDFANDYDDHDFASDDDDQLNEDMGALKNICKLTGKDSMDALAVVAQDHNDDNDDDDCDDDAKFLEQVQNKLLSTGNSNLQISLLARSNMEERQIEDGEDEDDADILRAIRNRFSIRGLLNMENASISHDEDVYGRDRQGRESKEFGFNDSSFLEPTTKQNVGVNVNGEGDTDANDSFDIIIANDIPSHAIEAPKCSTIPQYARVLINALIKNRSCQRALRNKLVHIELKMKENTEFRSRVKCLVDFQAECKRKLRKCFLQDNDFAEKFICHARSRSKKAKESTDNPVASQSCGPPENKDVKKYILAQKMFPDSHERKPWSNKDRENLFNGLKQQLQENAVHQAMENLSQENTDNFSLLENQLSAFSRVEVTPEAIRFFLAKVDWERVAATYVSGHSSADCQSRWLNVDDPLINHSPWSKDEDKKLLMILQQNGIHDWMHISNLMGTNRTPSQCLTRYQRSLNANIMRKEWTEEEDEQLRTLIETYGENDWQMVAANLEGRTNSQCLERWYKSLHPDRKKSGRWTVDEDKRLKLAVMVYGPKTWKKIAAAVSGRTVAQCRERWCNVLDPSLKLDRWTEEEDAKLKEAVSIHGFRSWSKVALALENRTDNQCWRRWKALHPKELAAAQMDAKIRKKALMGNFVGRKKEKPEIGPSDFSIEQEDLLSLKNLKEADENVNKKAKRSKRNTTEVRTCRTKINDGAEKGSSQNHSENANIRANALEGNIKRRAIKRKIDDGTANDSSQDLSECGKKARSSKGSTRRQRASRKEVNDGAIQEAIQNLSIAPSVQNVEENEQNMGTSANNICRSVNLCDKTEKKAHRRRPTHSKQSLNNNCKDRNATNESSAARPVNCMDNKSLQIDGHQQTKLCSLKPSDKNATSNKRKTIKRNMTATQHISYTGVAQPSTPPLYWVNQTLTGKTASMNHDLVQLLHNVVDDNSTVSGNKDGNNCSNHSLHPKEAVPRMREPLKKSCTIKKDTDFVEALPQMQSSLKEPCTMTQERSIFESGPRTPSINNDSQMLTSSENPCDSRGRQYGDLQVEEGSRTRGESDADVPLHELVSSAIGDSETSNSKDFNPSEVLNLRESNALETMLGLGKERMSEVKDKQSSTSNVNDNSALLCDVQRTSVRTGSKIHQNQDTDAHFTVENSVSNVEDKQPRRPRRTARVDINYKDLSEGNYFF